MYNTGKWPHNLWRLSSLLQMYLSCQPLIMDLQWYNANELYFDTPQMERNKLLTMHDSNWCGCHILMKYFPHCKNSLKLGRRKFTLNQHLDSYIHGIFYTRWEHDLTIRDIQHLTFTCIFHANPRLWLFGATLPPTNEKTLSTHYARLISTIVSISIKDILHCKIVLKLRIFLHLIGL